MLLRPIELVILLVGIFMLAYPALNNAAPSQLKPGEDASRFVLHYV